MRWGALLAVGEIEAKEFFPDKDYTREKFSFQISGHFPFWVQIKTDIKGERLNQIVRYVKMT
jgi:hypothetical protein